MKIKYLGFRYHGWMLQPGVKTIQGQLDKTIRFLYPASSFKTLACGRTDAMVSANESYVELFIKDLLDETQFLRALDLNLPQDIQVTNISRVSKHFEVIGHVQFKEYHYLFTDYPMSPFCSGMMTKFREKLDFNIMQRAANFFEGRHWFGNYCYRKKNFEKDHYFREILESSLVENDEYCANFFPERSYLYKVRGKGFMRHQVRIMVGAMINLGRGSWSWETFKKSFDSQFYSNEKKDLKPFIAPASGLILNQVKYQEKLCQS